MKDKTASAFGTPGFSHYKIPSKFEDLNRIDTFLSNAPLIVGFVPTAWLNVTDLQIPKKIDNPRVICMRCIQLFEGQYNTINKILGRRVMWNAEKEKLIEADQFGTRKRHKAICALLNKVILNDIFRQLKTAGALAVNDAKGCYDRKIILSSFKCYCALDCV